MQERTELLVVALVTAATFVALAAPDLGIGLASDLPFSPGDPAAEQLSRPVLGAPDGAGWLGTTLLSRLALVVPAGTEAQRLGALALLAGVLGVALTFLLFRRLGLAHVTAAAAALVAATGGTTLSLVTTGSVDALLLPCLPGLLLLGTVMPPTRRWAALAAPAAVAALTVGSYPALAPVAGCAAFSLWRLEGAARRPAWAVLAGAGLGLLHRFVAAGLSVPEGGTLPVFGVARGMPAVEALAAVVAGEFGFLGALLLLIGVGALWKGDRRPLAVLWVLAALMPVLWVSAVPAEAERVRALMSWLVVGVGLDWLWRTSASAGGRAGVVALGLGLAGTGLADHLAGSTWERRLATPDVSERLRRTLSTEAGLVAERPLLDRALALGGLARRRLALDPPALRARLERVQPTYALSEARATLAARGLQFESIDPLPQTTSFERVLRALPRRTVVAVALGPDSGVSGAALRTLGVGSAAPGTPFRVVVGVAGLAGEAVRVGGEGEVTVTVDVGQDVGTFPVRAAAGLAASSGPDGVEVSVNGEVMAATGSGLALVAVAPDGAVRYRFGGAPDHVVVPPVSAIAGLGRLVGAEACVPLPSGDWVDISSAARSGAVGMLLPSPGTGALTLYVTTRSRVSGGATRRVSDAVYRPEDEGDRRQLDPLLGRDAPPFVDDLLAAPFVRRVVADTVGPHVLTLGEVPGYAVAHWGGGVPGESLEICGALWGPRRLDRGDTGSWSVPLEEVATRGWGWHDLERDGAGPFRWTRGTEAGVLVQLVSPSPLTVELRATAAVTNLTGKSVTVELSVNGVPVGEYGMEGGEGVYRWEVPITRWRVGMNHLTWQLSAAARPAALGVSDDQRDLGISVRALRLTPQGGSR